MNYQQPPQGYAPQGYGPPAAYGPPGGGYRAEQTLLAEQGIVVSSARFCVGATTYPLAGITSVSSFIIPAKYGPGIWMLLIGLLTLAIYGLGVIFLALGIYMIVTAKPMYVVRMATAGGQLDALVSKDGHFIQRTVGALNQAIIQRG